MKLQRHTFFACVVTILSISCLPELALWAQTPADSAKSQDKSWTSVTEPQNSEGAIPVRTKTTHTQSGNRTVETQSLQRLDSGGNYEPYRDVETETVRVNATTVRTVERSYVRDSEGQRRLMRVTEEESRTLPGGEVKTDRTTSNPDLSGGLQVVHKEIEDTKQTGPNTRETRISVLIPDINGGLTESARTEQRETRSDDHAVQFEKTTSVKDGAGYWRPREVRQGVIKEDGKEQTRDESVLQPDSDGKLAVVKRTISKEAAGASGETQATTETYTVDLPGATRDGTLHPVERVTTIHRAGQGDGQSTLTRVEQPNPGSPATGMRVTGETIEVVKPGPGGTTHQTRTVESLNDNGSPGAVWIDMGTSDKPAHGQVNLAAPAQATPAQAAPGKPTPAPEQSQPKQ